MMADFHIKIKHDNTIGLNKKQQQSNDSALLPPRCDCVCLSFPFPRSATSKINPATDRTG